MFRVEKYRPDTLDDVVSHKDITGTSELRFEKYTSPAIATGAVVENFIKKGRLPHLLFYGPPGTSAKRIHLETLLSFP
jgi:replication factor C subunit 3/5